MITPFYVNTHFILQLIKKKKKKKKDQHVHSWRQGWISCAVWSYFKKVTKWWLLNYQRRWSDKKWTFIKFHSIFYKKVSIFQIFLEKCHWNCAEKCQKDNIFNFLKVKSDKIGFWRMGSDFLLHKMSVTFLKCDMKSLKKW